MAAKNGAFSFLGKSGTVYNVSCYLDDTTEHLATFSTYGVAGANSDNRWIAPENCVLTDVSIDAATAITKLGVLRNGMPTGTYMTIAGRLASIATRPALRVPFPQGSYCQAIQYT